MRVVLEVQSGPLAGRKTWLRPGQRIAVGRTEGSECVISHDGQISSRHFAIECSSETCLVRDLGSSNGTFLNGQRVDEAAIKSGDRILAGQTNFIVLIEEALFTTPQIAPSPERVVSSTETSPSVAPSTTAVTLRNISIPSPKGNSRFTVPKPFDVGFADQDPLVRREALLAAAWTRNKWLLGYCREMALNPSLDHWDALLLLSILGKPLDLQIILTLGRHVSLGAERFQLLAKFGHPAVVDLILKSIRGPDPADAIAATMAFTRITGIEIDSESTAHSSAEQAWEQWKNVQGQFVSGSRWCRGIEVSQTLGGQSLEQLDMESRWEACLRGKYEGTWSGSLGDLERLPLPQ